MDKKRYFMKLAYNGRHYHGWQIQPNADTVQGTLNHALGMLIREKVNLMGAGRTDTGVHASEFYAHFDVSSGLGSKEDLEQLRFKLNNYLSCEIAVYDIFPVHPKAHARFDALSRTYKYFISKKKDPFNFSTSYFFYGELDVNRMNEAARILFSYKDFTSFSKVNTQTNTNLCDLYEANWEEEGDMLVFTIKANRFLRNMVRAIVGTLMDIGQHKLSAIDMHRVIQQQERSSAGFSAPARGLFLHHIEYPDAVFRGEKVNSDVVFDENDD